MVISAAAGSARAQVAGTATIGVSTEEMKLVALGWSVRKKIDDLIITPDQSVSCAIIGVGGFLGLGKKDVAVPVSQLKTEQNKIVLPGATKEALKAMPKFEYVN